MWVLQCCVPTEDETDSEWEKKSSFHSDLSILFENKKEKNTEHTKRGRKVADECILYLHIYSSPITLLFLPISCSSGPQNKCLSNCVITVSNHRFSYPVKNTRNGLPCQLWLICFSSQDSENLSLLPLSSSFLSSQPSVLMLTTISLLICFQRIYRSGTTRSKAKRQVQSKRVPKKSHEEDGASAYPIENYLCGCVSLPLVRQRIRDVE
jgi:hypothetical protein